MASRYPRSYNDALDILGSRKSRKLENNTYLIRDGEKVYVRLHDTNICQYNEDGTLTLDTGGWFTVTTKSRLNQCIAPLGFSITQVKGLWYFTPAVVFGKGCRPVLHPDGTITGAYVARAEVERMKELKKNISRYVRKFGEYVSHYKVPTPSVGDCLMCQAFGGSEHLISHMEEYYFVPTLLYNALHAAGYGDVVFYLVFNQTPEERGGMASFAVDASKRALRRYINRELGIGQ